MNLSKEILLASVTAMVLPLAAEATTVSLLAASYVIPESGSVGETLSTDYDIDAGELPRPQRVSAGNPIGSAKSSVSAAPNGMSFGAYAYASNFGGAGDGQVWSMAKSETTSEFRAFADGAITFDMEVSGLYNSLTDRDDDLPLTRVIADLTVITPSDTYIHRIADFDPASNAYDSNGTAFDDAISATIDLNAGDEVLFLVSLLAQAGDFPSLAIPREPLGSFFEAEVELTGSLFLRGQGVITVPGDDLVAAVPLPAGLPMLLAGLAGFGVIARRKNASRA